MKPGDLVQMRPEWHAKSLNRLDRRRPELRLNWPLLCYACSADQGLPESAGFLKVLLLSGELKAELREHWQVVSEC